MLQPAPSMMTINTKVKVTKKPRLCYAALAGITQDHQLRVGTCHMDWHGQIRTQLGQSTIATNEPVAAVAVATARANWNGDSLQTADFVTALQLGHPGALRLIWWRRAAGQPLAQVASLDTGEQVQAVSIAPLKADANSHVVTSLIDAAGNLKVIAWKLGTDGSITRGAEGATGAASIIRSAWVGYRYLVTAAKTTSGHLKLVYWNFPETGAAIQHGNMLLDKIGSAISVAHCPGAGNNLGDTVVATNVEGDLKMMRFGIAAV